MRDYVLKDISFEVKTLEKLSLWSATGAGKILHYQLISRFLRNQLRGSITSMDVDVKDFELESCASNIGVVTSRRSSCFRIAFDYNITLGNPDITREQVMYAADLAGAKSDFIERLPGGLDYNVIGRGATAFL